MLIRVKLYVIVVGYVCYCRGLCMLLSWVMYVIVVGYVYYCRGLCRGLLGYRKNNPAARWR
jgi:hypothetical protein